MLARYSCIIFPTLYEELVFATFVAARLLKGVAKETGKLDVVCEVFCAQGRQIRFQEVVYEKGCLRTLKREREKEWTSKSEGIGGRETRRGGKV